MTRPADLSAVIRPLVSVDVVIFSVVEGALRVLLARRPSTGGEPYPDCWALPGGLVDVERDRSLLDCALRKLRDKTGVAASYLEQLGSWGNANRDPRGWSATHAFFALLPAQDVVLAHGANPAEVAWAEADTAATRRLAFDHGEILAAAIARLRSKVEYTSLPAFLLTEPFTLPQLQQVYEIVLGRSVDKSAFRKRMLDAGFLQETGTVDGQFRRPAMAYRLIDRSRAALFPRTFSPRDASHGADDEADGVLG